MNRPQAAVLLGVKESASAAEIRKAYLTRSRLLHPDRFSGSPAEDIQAATAAMSQINAAYEILSNEDANQATDPVALIVQCGTCGQRNRVSTPGRAVCSICKEDLKPKPKARGAEHADSGFPRWGHGESSCGICGWGPARSVKFNSVTGWIIFWRWFTFEADCCRRCGIALYNENQRSLLLKGCWGLISPLPTVVAFVGNLARVGAVKSLDEPMSRYPYAITPLQIPLVFSTPWWKRPASLAATATALTAITVIIYAALSAPTKTAYVPPPASTFGLTTGLVGSCWADTADMTVSEVACDDPSASWVAYAEEPGQADQTTLCSVGSGRDALPFDGWDLCIARTALKLYMAVLVEDKSELYDIMTGPESDDDGTAGALMLFWAIASEVPSVRTRLGEAAAATDPKYQRAFTTSLIVIDTGNQHAFQPESAVAQMMFISTIIAIIANDPEGSQALEDAISVVVN